MKREGGNIKYLSLIIVTQSMVFYLSIWLYVTSEAANYKNKMSLNFTGSFRSDFLLGLVMILDKKVPNMSNSSPKTFHKMSWITTYKIWSRSMLVMRDTADSNLVFILADFARSCHRYRGVECTLLNQFLTLRVLLVIILKKISRRIL